MKHLPLPLPTQEELNRLFYYEPTTGWLHWRVKMNKRHYVGMRAGNIHAKNSSIQIKIYGISYMAHRLIWKLCNNTEPPEIDHKDLNPSNNMLLNLRAATRSKNEQNKLKPKSVCPTARLKGVYQPRNRKFWVAQIKKNRVHYYLGSFNSEKKAHAAYVAKAKELFGEFFNAGIQ